MSLDRVRMMAGAQDEMIRLSTYTLKSNEYVDVGIIAPNKIVYNDTDGFMGSFWLHFDSSYDDTKTRNMNQIVFTNVTTSDKYSFRGSSYFYINDTQYLNDAGSSTGTENGILHNIYNNWSHNNSLWRYTIGYTSLKYRWYTYDSNPYKETEHYLVFGSKSGNSANMIIDYFILEAPISTRAKQTCTFYPYKQGNKYLFYDEQSKKKIWVRKSSEDPVVPTGGTEVYALTGHTCNGTSSRCINTGLRLFNSSDFPNGFKIEFKGKITKSTSSYGKQWNVWFTCQYEGGAPYQGFKISQNSAYTANLYYELLQDYQGTNSSGPINGLSVGDTVEIEILYDMAYLSAKINGTTYGCSGPITPHNFPLSIGDAMSSATTMSGSRLGNCQIDFLKVYKL